MAFRVPDSLAGSGGLTVEGVIEIDAFDNVARFSDDVSIPVTVRKNSTGSDFTRNRLNFIEGTNITITVADDATDDEIDITIESTGGGGLSPIADDTFLANISGSSAVPTAVALTTLAGDGLTGGADAILAVGASTSIIVSTNDIQRAALVGDITAAQDVNTTAFRSFAAKSVLANATNAGAVPSELAGSAAFQHLRVNSANNALEWATLSGYASTSLIYNSNTFERAALTGAVTAAQNSNATLFGGIRVNGSSTTDRTNINFIAGTGVTLTPTDDAGGDEIEITIDATGVGLSAIADQRVLGNDSGSSAVPTAITVHQELDWINGAIAWVYDNVDDQVRMGDFLSKERTDQFTISVWFATNTTSDSKMFSKLLAAGTNRGWQLFLLNGQVFFQLISDTGTLNLVQRRTNDLFNDGRLHCATAVYTGTSLASGITLYIDGVAVATTASGASLSATTLSAGNLQIGGFDTTASFGPGILMHASVWGDDLTALEAAELYGNGTPPNLTTTSMAADLQGWWKLDADDVTGASGVADASGAGHPGTANGGLAPVPVVGSLITQGLNGWGMTFPHTSGMPLVTQGYGVTPAYKQISLAALPNIADDVMLVNISGASAAPQERTLANMAGDGLVYDATNHHWDVQGSTSITITSDQVQRAALTGAITAGANSNTTAFGTLAAKSVLANATNSTAVPAALAGSAAFQYLRVNSGNTGLEWAVLSLAAFPTMAAGTVLVNITASTAVPTAHSLTTLAGGGLTYTNVTGIMAVGAGTGITVNADDVALANMAANTIKANATGSSAAPGDLAIAQDQIPGRFGGNLVSYALSALAGPGLAYSGGEMSVGQGNDIQVNANDVALAPFVELEVSTTGTIASQARTGGARHIMYTGAADTTVDNIAAGSYRGQVIVVSGQNGRVVLPDNAGATAAERIANPANESVVIMDEDFVPFAYLDDSSSSDAPRWCNLKHTVPFVNTTACAEKDKIVHDGSNWTRTQALRKSLTVCEWHEDFECVNGSSATGPHHFGNTVWITTALSTSGSIVDVPNEQNHPGIASVQTDTGDGSVYCIHRGGTDTTDPWVRGNEIKEFNVIAKYNTSNNLGALFMGFSENVASLSITGVGNSNIIGFFHDSDSDTSIHCVTREEDGTAVDTDTGSNPGTDWHRYTIKQTTLGTVEFLIDGAVVATHSTQIPDTESMNCGITVVNRNAVGGITQLYVDYVDFESHPLTR